GKIHFLPNNSEGNNTPYFLMTSISNTDHHCEHQPPKAAARKKERTGILSAILLALLPKCPFCLMAYSSTVMLCENGAGMHGNSISSGTSMIITGILCPIILGSVMLNYQGKKTNYALLLIVIGIGIILGSFTILKSVFLYYSGILVLFSGI